MSDQGGRSNILAELERVGIRLDKDDRRVGRVLEEVKAKEAEGYAFEGADASFYLLVKRVLGEVPRYFDVERFNVSVERRHNALGELVSVAEAIVKVRVGDEVLISAAEGNGPVNALDVALRKDLGKYQDLIQDLELVDYKVRIFQGGTDAVTRVLIEFGDRAGRALVHRRRLAEHHRRLVPGADRFDHLQADARRRDGVKPSTAPEAGAAIRQSVKRIVFSLQTSNSPTSTRPSFSNVACTATVQPLSFGSLTTVLALAASGFDTVAVLSSSPVITICSAVLALAFVTVTELAGFAAAGFLGRGFAAAGGASA